MNQPVGRNSKCPCGSGRKYKQCCLKSVQYSEDETGTIRRSAPMSDELGDMLTDHMDGLSEELGRDLTPEDELFPNMHTEHIEHGIVEAMKSAGLDPAMIYAFEQTGLLISDENQHLISDTDKAKWESAVDEYRQKEILSIPSKMEARDKSLCWSCDRKLPQYAVRCMHCEAKVEDAPGPEEAEMLMEFLGDMDPSLMDEIRRMAMESESGDDFVNRLMVGPCPTCDSDDTGDCENDPEIDDPCIGRCFECSQLFCCDCDELFIDTKEAVGHNCPMWDDEEEEF